MSDAPPPPGSLPGAASLVEQLDKRLLVRAPSLSCLFVRLWRSHQRLALQIVLRDGRHLVGTMRCFDQFSNVVMEDTYERHVVDGLYGDIPLGLYMIRGDSIVLAGELDDRDSSESALKQVGGSDRELPNADR